MRAYLPTVRREAPRLGGTLLPSTFVVRAGTGREDLVSDPVQSTMQDAQLTITSMLRHGERVYADSVVRTFEGDSVREATYAQVAERAARLAGALTTLGVQPGERVGTFLWNTQEHLES